MTVPFKARSLSRTEISKIVSIFFFFAIIAVAGDIPALLGSDAYAKPGHLGIVVPLWTQICSAFFMSLLVAAGMYIGTRMYLENFLPIYVGGLFLAYLMPAMAVATTEILFRPYRFDQDEILLICAVTNFIQLVFLLFAYLRFKKTTE